MPFGADHVQAAELGDAVAELDVGAAAGHVGRDRHAAPLAGLRHDLGLDLVVLGVQDLVLDALRLPAMRSTAQISRSTRVPTRTGTPCLFHSAICSATAWNCSSDVE